jgi:hypothetical protein
MKPLIGITGRKDASARLLRYEMHSVGDTYTRAIYQMGGVPVILPPLTTAEDWPLLVERLDGLLLSAAKTLPRSSTIRRASRGWEALTKSVILRNWDWFSSGWFLAGHFWQFAGDTKSST